MSDKDRNFDDLAQRFSDKVYGGLKGQIRLAVIERDLQALAKLQQAEQPLRILDVGGGLGQISLLLAQAGHQVVFNDVSQVMLNEAKSRAEQAGVADQFTWIVGAYQQLSVAELGQFDVVLNHAVLEWVETPQRLIQQLADFCLDDGYLSLCFYNPAAKIYRNLIGGNFKLLNQAQAYQSNPGSLTPNNPCSVEQVQAWLAESGFDIETMHVSGLRVFHDYVVNKRGGHQHPEQVLAMEMQYAQHPQFKWLGRYLHCLVSKTPQAR